MHDNDEELEEIIPILDAILILTSTTLAITTTALAAWLWLIF